MNRLSELNPVSDDDAVGAAAADGEDGDVELSKLEAGKGRKGDTSQDAAEGFMGDFFREVEAVQANITLIKRNVRSIQSISNELIVGAAGEEANSRKTQELDQLITETNKVVSETHKKLEAMAQENKKTDKNATPAEIRIRNNMHGNLCKKFTAVARAYGDVQTAYQNSSRERLARQCKVVRPELKDEEIEAIVDQGDDAVFRDAILEHDLRDKAKQALSYVENKHNDIVKLNNSIMELHQLFVDMSVLVAQQGELIDQIEDNCNMAAEYTSQGVKAIREAAVIQKKSRKKLCWIVILIAVVVIILVVTFSVLGKFFL